MNPTDLIEHPEGGRYKEVYRSISEIKTEGKTKSALTHIYFSLNSGEVSHFHKVSSDEIWNLYKGTGLYLFEWDGTSNAPKRIELSESANCFCHVIPAGAWQAAVPIDETVLVGCSVAPGFEFEDFILMDPSSDEAKDILSIDKDMNRFIPA